MVTPIDERTNRSVTMVMPVRTSFDDQINQATLRQLLSASSRKEHHV